MSALCQKRTLCSAAILSLFDHLVGATEKRQRNRNAERLGSVGVNDQLELRRLQDREVGRLVAAEYTPSVATNQAISVAKISSVTHQAACHRVLAERINCGKCMAVGERDQLIAHGHEKRVSAQEERVSALCDQGRKDRFDLACGACIQKQQAQPQSI